MRTALLLGAKYAAPYIRRKVFSAGKKLLGGLVPEPGQPAVNPFVVFAHRRPRTRARSSMSKHKRPLSVAAQHKAMPTASSYLGGAYISLNRGQYRGLKHHRLR